MAMLSMMGTLALITVLCLYFMFYMIPILNKPPNYQAPIEIYPPFSLGERGAMCTTIYRSANPSKHTCEKVTCDPSRCLLCASTQTCRDGERDGIEGECCDNGGVRPYPCTWFGGWYRCQISCSWTYKPTMVVQLVDGTVDNNTVGTEKLLTFNCGRSKSCVQALFKQYPINHAYRCIMHY